MLFHGILPFVTATTICASTVAAASSIIESHLPLGGPSLDIEELTSKLLHGPIHQPEVYARAISILESMEAAPSCHRMATLTLINSCQSLERSKTAEVALTEVREEYATRLAICEFMGAKVAFPSQCNLFVPQDRGCKKRFSFSLWDKPRGDYANSEFTGDTCYRDVGSVQVKQCLGALHARPQWWTSYSNALQNVVVVCQASRSSIEKDEILELFRTGTAITGDLTKILLESIKNAKEFSGAVDRFQLRAKASLDEQLSQSKDAFSQLILNIQNAVQNLLGIMNEGAEDAAEKLSGLQKDIARNHEQVIETDQDLQNLHKNAIRRNQDIESAQLASWKQVSTQAGEVENSLQSVVQWELPAIDRFLQNYLQHLKNFTEILSEGNAALESHINRNNEKLERQVEIIAQVQTLGSSDDLTKWTSFFIVMVLLQSLSPQMTAVLGGLAATLLVVSKLTKLIISFQTGSLLLPLSFPALFLPRPVLLSILILASLNVLLILLFAIYTYLKSSTISKKDGFIMLRVEEPNYNLVNISEQHSFARLLRSASEER